MLFYSQSFPNIMYIFINQIKKQLINLIQNLPKMSSSLTFSFTAMATGTGSDTAGKKIEIKHLDYSCTICHTSCMANTSPM